MTSLKSTVILRGGSSVARLLGRSWGFVPMLAGCVASAPPPSADSPLLGEPLPRLTRPFNAAPFDAEQFEGRVVVVKFFAHYCEPCERTLPVTQRLHQSHPEATFIGVSLDERQSHLRATIRRYGLTFPIIHDHAHVVAGRFRVTELPTTFVLDVEGRVRWVAGPEQNEHDLELALDSFL